MLKHLRGDLGMGVILERLSAEGLHCRHNECAGEGDSAVSLTLTSTRYSLVSGRSAPNRRTSRKPAAPNVDPSPAIAAPLTKALADLDRHHSGVTVRLHGKITRVVNKEKVILQLVQENARFAMQQSTLTSRGGMLAAKFSNTDRWRGRREGACWRPSSATPTDGADVGDGSIFLDKDGDSFEWVLDLPRGYPMPQSLTEQQMVSLQHDLQYFGLHAEQFVGGVETDSWVLAPSPNGAVWEEGLMFTKTSGACGWKCGVLRGVHEWTVVLRARAVDSESDRTLLQNLRVLSGALYGQDRISDRPYSPVRALLCPRHSHLSAAGLRCAHSDVRRERCAAAPGVDRPADHRAAPGV